MGVAAQLVLDGIEPEPLRWCASCKSWLPRSCFYPAYRFQRREETGATAGGSGYCKGCHLREGRRRR